jgi:hypothetical protein
MTNTAGILLSATLALASFSAFATTQVQCPVLDDDAGGKEGPWNGAKLEMTEGFESATLNLRYATGFRWTSSMNRSIVRDDQYIVWKGQPMMEGPVVDPPRQWEGYTGTHALRFSFPAGNNGFSEQRFSLGKAYPELWIGYWLRVPINWEHGSGNSNNKFFAIWMDEYERVGPTGVIQTRNSGGDSKISPYVRTRNNRHLGEEAGKLLIDSSRDRGRWMQVVIHVKMASGASNADGVFELYRRWEDANEFENIFAYDNWDNYHVGGNRGFAHGYLMGWANATQPKSSEWLLDDFVVSASSLLDVDASVPPSDSPSGELSIIPEFIIP